MKTLSVGEWKEIPPKIHRIFQIKVMNSTASSIQKNVIKEFESV